MKAIEKKSRRVETIKLVVNTDTINTYKKTRTVKPYFVSERVTGADPQTLRFEKILNFWATIVIQIFLHFVRLQQSTLFESFSKHFCIHYFYVVKDSKQLLIIQFSTTPRNSR